MIYSHIRRYGDTSPNTIPFALAELIESGELAETVVLTAFGDGFTYGRVCSNGKWKEAFKSLNHLSIDRTVSAR